MAFGVSLIGTSLGAAGPQRPRLVVGFAAETEHLLDHARKKIVDKKLDLICVNDVSQGHIGFNSDQNEITLVHAEGHEKLPLTTKTTLARLVMEQLTTLYLEQQRAK